MKRFLIYGFLFCLVILSFAPRAYADPDNWLDVHNFYRGMAGLPIVLEDPAWSKECEQLAKYMVENDICSHQINPVATESNLSCPGPVETDPMIIEGWIKTSIHGQHLLSPALHKVGFGSYTGKVTNKNSKDYGYTLTAGAMNVLRGLGTVPSTVKYPTFFPGDGSYMPLEDFGTTEYNPAGKDVLKTYCGKDYSASSGSTIFLRTGDGTGYADVTSNSFWQDGAKRDHCLLDAGGGAIAIVPKEKLKQESDYEVSIKVAGKEYKWSFTTRANKMWLGGNILWRNSITAQNAIWHMVGPKVNSVETWYENKIANTSWEIVGTGDFNNDGHTDIVWRNAVNGQNALAIMKSKTDSGVLCPLQNVSDVNWKIVGIGDFNKDNRVDIFWHNPTKGTNRIWLMDRCELLSDVGTSATSDTNWKVVGAGGNFKDERGADVLWRNSVTGANAVWYMNGTKFLGSMDYIRIQPDLGWNIAATGYFNNDDRPDILWRHNWGFNAVWYMDGHFYKGSDWLGYFWVHPNWKIVGTGRFQ